MRDLRLGVMLGASICALSLSGCARDYSPWPGLVGRYESAVGNIVATYCHERGRIGYQFTVDGRRYANTVYRHPLKQACSEIRIGEPLLIYYDPTNPEISTPMPPRDAYDRYLDRGNGWIALGVLVLLLLLAPLLQMWMGRSDPAFKRVTRRPGQAIEHAPDRGSDRDSDPKA